jgi:hypothetical protein
MAPRYVKLNHFCHWALPPNLYECKGSANGKFFKMLKVAHFKRAISSRIREGCEGIWWILKVRPCYPRPEQGEDGG